MHVVAPDGGGEPVLASPGVRLAMGIEYDGSDFHGWQRLGKRGVVAARTVQEVVEDALSRVAAMPVDTICAGRTDAGVHGLCQVVHFDTAAVRSLRSWELGTTANLPPDVSLRWCVPVAHDFNARFSARARRYRYVIANRALRPALARRMVTWVRPSLDAGAMHAAAQALVGEHDFSALRTVHCQAPHARRDLHAISVVRDGDRITIDVRANAFLHHMVRNIVGSLLMVGGGERPVAWMAQILAGRDRTLAGPTAPATGLVFVGPCYPPQWGLPSEVTMPAPTGV